MFFIHAHIVTMEGDGPLGTVYPDGFLQVQGTKIEKIGPMSEYAEEEGEPVRDLSGLTIYPGFIDAHCHMGLAEEGLGFEGEDLNEITDPVTPHLRGIDAINPNNKSFPEAWNAGVTTVITGPGSANPIAGQFCALKTYGKQVDKMILKAPVAMKFALGENPKGCYNEKAQTPTTRMAIAAVIREQLQKARRYQEDILKAEEDEEGETDPPEFDAKCEALLPLLKREIKAHFHCHRADDIFTAVRIAKEFNLDFALVHCTEGHLIAEELAEEGVQVITGPLMTTRSKPELANSTDANPGILHQAGVLTAICTDYNVQPIGFLPVMAGVAVREGMDHSAALRAITVNAAEICSIGDRVGSLKPGKDADFAAFDCDPLTLAAKPSLVVINGKMVRG